MFAKHGDPTSFILSSVKNLPLGGRWYWNYQRYYRFFLKTVKEFLLKCQPGVGRWLGMDKI